MAEAVAHGLGSASGGAAGDAPGAAHYRALRGAYALAEGRRGPVVHELGIAGATLGLRFAGDALVPLVLPPLRHLLRPAGGEAPSATVCVWDSESTAVASPPLPWRRRDVDSRWEVRGYNDERTRTHHDPEALVLTVFDTAERTALWWAPSPALVPWYDRAAPLRTALHWALTTPGRHLLHAGAVAGPGGALLLVGKGGSGKSTTAVLCLEAGFDYLGDDYVVFVSDEVPAVHSLYGTAKVTPETVGLVPRLASGKAVLASADKTVVDAALVRPERMRRSAPVAAVVVPSVGDRARSRLRPVAAAQALRALAPSTVLQLPHEARAALVHMAALVRAVPSYALELGRDADEIPALLRSLVT